MKSGVGREIIALQERKPGKRAQLAMKTNAGAWNHCSQSKKQAKGAKGMILVDNVDDRELLCELVESMFEELPAPRKKKK